MKNFSEVTDFKDYINKRILIRCNYPSSEIVECIILQIYDKYFKYRTSTGNCERWVEKDEWDLIGVLGDIPANWDEWVKSVQNLNALGDEKGDNPPEHARQAL